MPKLTKSGIPSAVTDVHQFQEDASSSSACYYCGRSYGSLIHDVQPGDTREQIQAAQERFNQRDTPSDARILAAVKKILAEDLATTVQNDADRHRRALARRLAKALIDPEGA